MTKATVTQGKEKYGLFLTTAYRFTEEHLLQGKTYDTEVEATAAMTKMKKELVHSLRDDVVVHVVEETGLGEEPNYGIAFSG
jgi:hypothetical protein